MTWRRALLVQTAGHQDDGYENCEVRVDLWWVHVRYLIVDDSSEPAIQCPAETMLHRDFVKRILWAEPEDNTKQVGFQPGLKDLTSDRER